MNLSDLQDKKIAILGYGVEGQATGQYLTEHKIAFDILDRKDDPQYLSKLGNYEIVFRSPGISILMPEIIEAQKAGVIFTSQIKYFFDNCPAKIIGVTGTKGKGTTSQLIYEILSAQFPGKNFLGGNIGMGVLQLLENLHTDDWVVLELSSFQLQDLEKSPHIAVVLMVTSEHLDYHHDLQEYVQAKSSITQYQNSQDFAVINCDYENSRLIGQGGAAQKYFVHTFGQQEISQGIAANSKGISLVENGQVRKIFDLDFKLPGYHNIQNICAALQTSLLAGAELEPALQVAKNFVGLEHRLEFVAEVNGIKFYNDSIGTTPESTIAAAQAFTEPEILIIGGYDKKGDYAMLAAEISKMLNIKAAVLIGDIAPQLEKYFQDAGAVHLFTGAKNMSEVFEKIRGIAQKGDVVILAPGTSSFDWYANYKERGNEFKKLVLEF